MMLPFFNSSRSVEQGYHRYLRTLLACYCASLALAHSVLLEFNFRWNVNMMVKNRGLPASLGGHYNQYLIELIQRATADWDPSCPVFPQWPATIDSVDTGERSGLARSVWGGDGKEGAWSSTDDEALRVDEAVVDVNGRTPLSYLPLSSERYAKLMGESMPETRVHTQAERRKFREELPQNYWHPGDGGAMGRGQQFQPVKFNDWAREWNAYCDQIKKGEVKFVAVYRKTARHLEEYYAVHQRQANASLTMYPMRSEADALRSDLQQSMDGAAFEGSVGQTQPVSVSFRRAPGAGGLPPGGIVAGGVVSAAVQAAVASGQFGPQGGGVTGASASGSGSGSGAAGAGDSRDAVPAAGLALQGTGRSGAGGGSSRRVAPVTIRAAPVAQGLAIQSGAASSAGASTSLRRRPQTCIECGHCTSAKGFVGDYPGPNTKGARCQVSQEKRRPDSERTGRMSNDKHRKTFGRCQCPECKPRFDAFDASLGVDARK